MDENKDTLQEGTDLQDAGLGRDPLYPETTAEDGENNAEPKGEEAPKDLSSSISDRLSKSEEAGEQGGVVEPESAMPFDITKLSREQIQTLKQMLAATPDSQQRKKSNPKIFLRRIDGKMVADYKRAYVALVNDPENNRKVERHVIPIKFFGESAYQDILFSQFINSERVACEVIQTRQQVEEYIEGETISRETGLPVEMVRKEVKYWFTVKLPNGETVEVEARLANA